MNGYYLSTDTIGAGNVQLTVSLLQDGQPKAAHGLTQPMPMCSMAANDAANSRDVLHAILAFLSAGYTMDHLKAMLAGLSVTLGKLPKIQLPDGWRAFHALGLRDWVFVNLKAENDYELYRIADDYVNESLTLDEFIELLEEEANDPDDPDSEEGFDDKYREELGDSIRHVIDELRNEWRRQNPPVQPLLKKDS